MVTGIIAEFNMLHNGHKYIIDKAREKGGGVIAVMSGSFAQRGDVCVYDKWTRAKTALISGVDLVLELPVCYALSAAPNFAQGGVSTLNALGIVDELIFGSESGDISALKKAANILSDDLKAARVKEYLSEGLSYPTALSRVYEKDLDAHIMREPNNVLAIEYIRAINKLNSSIEPVTVKRYMTEHDSTYSSGGYASATALREMAFSGESIEKYVPYEMTAMPRPRCLTPLSAAIMCRLRTISSEELSGIGEVTEGLENRIIRAAKDTDNIEDLLAAVKSKRYTMSKIRRIVIGALIGNRKDIFKPAPDYIRVLGMNKKGTELLKAAKEKCALPVITKVAEYKEKSKQFDLDTRATDIAALCDKTNKKGGADFTRSPMVLI